jgi:hypothetical protein
LKSKKCIGTNRNARGKAIDEKEENADGNGSVVRANDEEVGNADGIGSVVRANDEEVGNADGIGSVVRANDEEVSNVDGNGSVVRANDEEVIGNVDGMVNRSLADATHIGFPKLVHGKSAYRKCNITRSLYRG